MNVFTVTLTHVDLELLEASLARFYEMAELKHNHILLDHHWPVNYWKHRHAILDLAEKYNCKVMCNYENMGGTQGNNWLLRNIPIKDGDVLLGYDGDSFPVTKGFDRILIEGLKDPSFAALSLKINADLLTKQWEHSVTSTGIKVMKPARNGIEMINVTAWNYTHLKNLGLFQGAYAYYGQVEAPMQDGFRAKGLKHAYTVEACEEPRKYPGHPVYIKWKHEHVGGRFPGNFSEYWRLYGKN